MLDERREIRDKRVFELSSRPSFWDHLWKSSWRPVGSIGSIVVLFALVLITACTDYVSQIEDRYGEWNDGHAQVSSSSITQKSSSSVAQNVVDPSTVVRGSITDSRDGQTYKTVTIGTQTWMAQNLNYETANSYCYKDSAKYCSKYGRLYTWAAAMDSAGTWGTNGVGCGLGSTCSPTYPVRGVCPMGWHLPITTEFATIFNAVGSQSTVGKKLKATNGWNGSSNGTDDYSFSALPAGSYAGGVFGYYYGEGYHAYFWSSGETNGNFAISEHLSNGSDEANPNNSNKDARNSVRCVKD